MTESVENLIQLVLTGLCAALSFGKAIASWKRPWLLLGLFYSVFFFGDLYWQLFITFYGDTPQYSFIPYLSWYAADLFLFMLLTVVYSYDWKRYAKYLWPVPVFTAGMCVFYMTYGDYLSNIIAAALMYALKWRSIGGIISLRKKTGEDAAALAIHILVLLFCFTEYAAWTSSCFFEGDTFANPYYWFDAMQTAVLVLFIPALRKAVSR